MTTAWRERAQRGLALGAMNQYETVADALFEIIDNPMDYRFGRKLTVNVSVQKEHDLVVVEDSGGEGMDDEGIDDWLNWGSGHPHQSRDIGRYHYGGKAATGFLANHIRITARRANTRTVWVFEDREWATREEWANYEKRTQDTRELPIHLRNLPADTGFVRIELRDLHKTRRYRLDDLRFRLSNVYRRLIIGGEISIALNGAPVQPLALPESSSFSAVEICERLQNRRRLRGRVWRLNRDEALQSKYIKGGVRTLFNGRLITEGEYFGYYAEGKGLLNSLVGEIELDWCKPVPTKTAWIKDSEEWYEVEESMKSALQPIIRAFREAAERNPVSREEKKRCNQVHRQLNQALRLIRASDGSRGEMDDQIASKSVEEAGRKAASPREDGADDEQAENHGRAGTRGPTKNPSPPPEDAVGALRRLVDRLEKSGGFPPIRPDSLFDKSLRSGRGIENGTEVIVVNTIHSMYTDLEGDASYIAETAILEMLRPEEENETLHASEYYGQALQLLNAWYKVVGDET